MKCHEGTGGKIIMGIEDNVKRIADMEERLNRLNDFIKKAEELCGCMHQVSEDADMLGEYLESSEWKEDFALDENGELPEDLKRGVLSEDGIWNSLEAYRELKEEIRKI